MANEASLCTQTLSTDPHTLVTVQVLWDCCVNCPAFPYATQAVALILRRALDTEESVRKLAMQLCGALWFSNSGLAAGARVCVCVGGGCTQ